MDQTARFSVTTSMEGEDCRKFLYIATFRQDPKVIPLILAVALVGAIFISLFSASFSLLGVLGIWVGITIFAVAVICFKLERRNKKRLKTDHTGSIGTRQTLDFCEDHIIACNPATQSTGQIGYDQFYRLMETNDYFILYHHSQMGSLIRKKDVENPEALAAFLREKFAGRYRRIKGVFA